MCTDADLSNCVLLPLIFFFHIPCFLSPYILDSKIIVMMFYSLQVRTVKVTNVSLSATVQDIKEFFSFSGDIEHVEMQRFIKIATCTQLRRSGLPFTSSLIILFPFHWQWR